MCRPPGNRLPIRSTGDTHPSPQGKGWCFLDLKFTRSPTLGRWLHPDGLLIATIRNTRRRCTTTNSLYGGRGLRGSGAHSLLLQWDQVVALTPWLQQDQGQSLALHWPILEVSRKTSPVRIKDKFHLNDWKFNLVSEPQTIIFQNRHDTLFSPTLTSG